MFDFLKFLSIFALAIASTGGVVIGSSLLIGELPNVALQVPALVLTAALGLGSMLASFALGDRLGWS